MKKIITILASVVLAISSFGQAVNYSTTVTAPAIVETGATSNLTSTPLAIKPGWGVGVGAYFAGTNAGSGLLVCNLDVSADGSTWTSYAPGQGYRAVFTQNGATATRTYTNLPAALFDSSQYVRISSITNSHASSLFVSNLFLYRVARIPTQ